MGSEEQKENAANAYYSIQEVFKAEGQGIMIGI